MSVRGRAHARDGGVVHRLKKVWGESPFYQAQLRGPAPDRLYFSPQDPRESKRDIGEMMFRGRLTVGDESVDVEGDLASLWDRSVELRAVDAYLQDFSWLRHMAALGEDGRNAAKTLVRAWLDRYENWSADAWATFAAAERVMHLCCHGGFLLKGEDALWRSRLLTSMARQTRHLARSGHRAKTDFDRLIIACGLTIAGLCLPGCEAPLDRGLETLRRELRLQIRPDGGHVSRNPSRQLSIVIRLQMIIEAFGQRGLATPGYLAHVNARATAFLKLFRCGDGRLAVFNGGYEDDGKALASCLANGGVDALPAGFARRSGFQRLEAGRMALIADTGLVDRARTSAEASPLDRFEGIGAFQLSSGRARIVVNCGSGDHLSGEWSRALRRAAAHSSLSADRQSPDAAVLASAHVTHRRGENAQGQLLEIERSLARESGRVAYNRRFYVAAGGEDVRGEDRLSGVSPAVVWDLALRFHLHPAVKASMARDGVTVLLSAPNHEGWRFKSNCDDISLEKSVYCGAGAGPVATEQIVVRPGGLEPGRDGDMVVKWAFRRVDAAQRRFDA